MAKYIYQYENWTDFTWQNAVVSAALGEVRLLQGKILGQIHLLGFSSIEEKNLEMLTPFPHGESHEISDGFAAFQIAKSIGSFF